MSTGFARVIYGKFFDRCDAWWKKHQAANEAVNALALAVGATPGRSLSAGKRLEGFYFARPPAKPSAWRAAGKKFPGYYKPDIRRAGGKELERRLLDIELQTGEDLAHELGLPPFFKDLQGDWCTAAGCFMRGGAFYIEFPAGFSHHFAKKDGVELIPEWQHMKARDEV